MCIGENLSMSAYHIFGAIHFEGNLQMDVGTSSETKNITFEETCYIQEPWGTLFKLWTIISMKLDQ